jgi:hypothetical protein
MESRLCFPCYTIRWCKLAHLVFQLPQIIKSSGKSFDKITVFTRM